MVKTILLRSAIELIALFLILSGLDMILGNQVAFATNIIISLIAVSFRTMLTMKKYYAYKMQEQDEEINKKD